MRQHWVVEPVVRLAPAELKHDQGLTRPEVPLWHRRIMVHLTSQALANSLSDHGRANNGASPYDQVPRLFIRETLHKQRRRVQLLEHANRESRAVRQGRGTLSPVPRLRHSFNLNPLKFHAQRFSY